MRRFPALAGLLAATAVLPCSSFAQGTENYPSKPVRAVVAAAAGGASDILARTFTQELSATLGQQIVVDNRSGAGGIPAYRLVSEASPDGYTLLFTSAAFTYGPALYRDFPDPNKDFTPITLATKAPYLIVAYPGLAVTSIKELIALAKATPGALNIGVTNGGFTHIAAVYLSTAAGIKLTYVPYKGSGQITVDTMAGRLHLTFGNVLSFLPHVKSGKLRALAVSAANRSALVPDLPTVSESGLPGFDISSWFGWLAPPGTPPAIVGRLSTELTKIIRSPGIVSRLAKSGGEAVGSTPEQFRKFIASETRRWTKAVKDSGMRVQ